MDIEYDPTEEVEDDVDGLLEYDVRMMLIEPIGEP